MIQHAPPLFDTYADVRAYLATQTDYEKMVRYTMKRGEFDLGRVERFFEALGAPQTAYECAHIAGTKGKGSTSHMLDAIVRAHGRTAGLYTSPHLEHECERIRVGGVVIDESELTAAFREMAPVLERFQRSGDSLTWFEIMTGAALVAFERRGIEIAVLETGLGGRLDATNVVMPAVTAITNIGHDHHDKLGPELTDIAYEKAGIIKPEVPLVTGQYDREALDVVLARAREMDAPVRRYKQDFEARDAQATLDGISFDLWGAGYRYRRIALPMIGTVQAKNAAVAVEMAHQMFARLGWGEPEEEAVRIGLAGCEVPGRCELVGGSPAVLLDVAHNDESIRQTAKTVAQRFAGRPIVLLTGMSKDKEIEELLRTLADVRPIAAVFTEFPSVRASGASDLRAIWQKYGGCESVAEQDWTKAFELALSLAGADGVVVVTGSFYLAGRIRPLAMARAGANRGVGEEV